MVKRSIVMLSALLLVTGCGDDEDTPRAAEGQVELDFWTFWGSETRRPIIEKMINDYNESQDEVFVKHTFLPWGDIWTKNLASIAAGNPADIIVNDINSVAQRADNNQVTDLSTYIDDEFMDQFYPNLRETVEVEDGTYAVPFNTDTRVLFYNKTAFEEAGLDPEQPPETWEELEEYAKQLDIKNGDRYEQIGFYPLWGSFGADAWMTNADDGRGFVEDGEVTVNTEKKVEAMEWVAQWRERYGGQTIDALTAEFGSEQANPFINGQVAMWVDVGTFYTQIRDYGDGMDFGVASIPAFDESSDNWSTGGGFVVEIPAGSDHPEEAMDFIEYITGEEAQKYWATENFDNVANIAGSEAALEELEGQEQEVFSFLNDNLAVTRTYPLTIEYPETVTKINPIVDRIMLGELEPGEGLDQAQKSIEQDKR
ncbi:ABC transporter substrate-binding protein [Jeotgalibacillus proteolyticus]|uniref:ABC transporter substrate-binding protein n=1 Tax=Jeotgalibacillus proteolyticus TaxID=2082395 RepID=A0A2S5GE16_9BACL|nr:ABC transporter substrate-binding protein [Jeotgalibacillus proteolyticus]